MSLEQSLVPNWLNEDIDKILSTADKTESLNGYFIA